MNREELAQEADSGGASPGKIALTNCSAARISGPYPHRGGYRCGFTPPGGERQWTGSADTEAGALRLAERAAAKHAREGATTLQAALDGYLQYKEKVGVRPATIVSTRNAAKALFRGVMDWPLWKITQRTCQQQYDQLREQVDEQKRAADGGDNAPVVPDHLPDFLPVDPRSRVVEGKPA